MSLHLCLASDGEYIPVDSLGKSIIRDEFGNILHIDVVWKDKTYRKAITRIDGSIVSTGTNFEWVLQP